MGLLDDPTSDPLHTLFGPDPPSLYSVLSLPTDPAPSASDIKKAYYRLALETHPDKAEPDAREEAAAKFQQVGFAYAVLSDEARRKRYDATGRTDEKQWEQEGFSWGDYFSATFEKVTWEAIGEDKKRYQGSQEELNDLKQAYTESKGDIEAILSSIPHASVIDDEERFVELLAPLIVSGDIPRFAKWDKGMKNETARLARRKRAEREAEEAEALRKELGLDVELAEGVEGAGEDALAMIIGKRNEERKDQFESLTNALEEKYGKKGKGKGKGGKGKKMKEAEEEDDEAPPGMPTDEEFEKLQAKLFGKKSAPADDDDAEADAPPAKKSKAAPKPKMEGSRRSSRKGDKA